MARSSKRLTGLTAEEMDLALSEHWGRDVDRWREVNVYHSTINMVSRGVSRVFVGLPTCRDQEYLQPITKFGSRFLLYAAGINFIPKILRPVIGPWIIKSDTKHFSDVAKVLLPIINRRMNDMTANTEANTAAAEEEKDILQYLIEDAFQTWDPKDLKAITICEQFVAFISSGTQSSRVAITSALFDLASSPSATEIFHILRAEAESVLESEGNIWTPGVVSKLVKHDSALRETLRMRDGRGPMKEVMAPEGITTPDGLYLPQGAKIGVYSPPVHYDADIYPDPTTYKPWRYLPDGGQSDHTHEPAVVTAKSGASATKPTREYMAFGYGKHSCPGRFFAMTSLKLLLAIIVLHYDIEPLPSRPKNLYLGTMIGPPIEATLRIKRRKEKAIPT
ncbi:MAG: hypothetical protein Q9160_006217 [Pyrenula sp. 1 TL-2023]